MAVVATVASVALDVSGPLLDRDTRQAVALSQAADANVKQLFDLAGQEQAAASRVAADAQQAAEAAEEALRYAEAARSNRLRTPEQIDEARASAERLSKAAEAARAKAQAAVVERIRAEDAAMARRRDFSAAVQRLRIFQTFATVAAVTLSWYGVTAIAERVSAPGIGGDFSAGGELAASGEGGRQRSAPDIVRGGLANLADDPFGWFFGAPSPLYSSSSPPPSQAAEPSQDGAPPSQTAEAPPPALAAPYQTAAEQCASLVGETSSDRSDEATRDPQPSAIDSHDPTDSQPPIHQGESLAQYLAKRQAGDGAAPATPPDWKEGFGDATRDASPFWIDPNDEKRGVE